MYNISLFPNLGFGKQYTIFWVLKLDVKKLATIDEFGEDEYLLLKPKLERKRQQEKENKHTSRDTQEMEKEKKEKKDTQIKQKHKKTEVSFIDKLFRRTKTNERKVKTGNRNKNIFARCKQILVKFAKDVRNSGRSGNNDSSVLLFMDQSLLREIINDQSNKELLEAIETWWSAKNEVEKWSRV